MAKATVAAVRRELLEQLEARGAKTPYFVNLIEQYCDFMEIARQLRGDIKKRGVTYEDNSSVGVVVQKNNPSVKELQGVNRQMLLILEKLGITTDKIYTDDDL